MSIARLLNSQNQIQESQAVVTQTIGGDGVPPTPSGSANADGNKTNAWLSLNWGDNHYVRLPGGNAPGALFGWYNDTSLNSDGCRLGYNINPENPTTTFTSGADGYFLDVGQGGVAVRFVNRTNTLGADTCPEVGKFNSAGFQGITQASVTIGGGGSTTVAYPGMTTGGIINTTTRHPGTAASHAVADTDQIIVQGGAGEVVTYQVVNTA